MEIHEIFGELDDKGQVKRKVNFTAEPEGLRVESGDAMVGVEGTNYFYYVKAQVFKRLSAEDRKTIESRVRPAPVASSAQFVAQEPPVRGKAEAKKDVGNDSSN